MTPVTLVIPGDPRGKGRPRFNRAQGRAFTDSRTANAEGIVKVIAMAAMGDRPPFGCPVEVFVRAILPIPTSWSKKRQAEALTGDTLPTGKPDLDNVLKLIWDGLNRIVFDDDSQITAVTANKEYGAQPMTVVTVKPIGMLAELLS